MRNRQDEIETTYLGMPLPMSLGGDRCTLVRSVVFLCSLVLLTAGCTGDAFEEPIANNAAPHLSPTGLVAQTRVSDVLAFTRATIVNPTGEAPQINMTVIVRGDRIAAVGRSGEVPVPKGATVVDAQGQFLLPGLWDSHTHISYPGACALPLLIAHGVTSIRDLGGPPAEGARWRQEVEAGRMVGPRIYLAGLNIESAEWINMVNQIRAEDQKMSLIDRIRGRRPPENSPIWEWSPRFAMASPTDAALAVDTAVKAGMDVVKFRNLPADAFRALVAEANRRGIPVAGHAPRDITLADAAEAGLRSLEHGANLSSLLNLSPGERAEQFRRIARSGMFVTPTLVSDGMWAPDSLVLAVIADSAGRIDPRRRNVSAHQLNIWRSGMEGRNKPVRATHDSAFAAEIGLVQAAHRAGVPLLAGTDVGTLLTYPGSSLHEELILLVDRVGLTPLEALQAAILNPARFFALEKKVGLIAPGMRADLVLLRDDPLRDIRNIREIEGVAAGGRYLDSAALKSVRECRER